MSYETSVPPSAKRGKPEDDIFNGDLERARKRYREMADIALQGAPARVLNLASFMLSMYVDGGNGYKTDHHARISRSLDEERQLRVKRRGFKLIKRGGVQ